METISPLTRVPGFKAVGVACGLKQSGQPDLALVLADRDCSAAAVFTTNAFKAAPVLYDTALLRRNGGRLRAVLVNAGNANAVTGEQGLRDAEAMARLAETTGHLPPDSVFVMSTGVIGHHLPMDRVRRGIALAWEAVQSEAGERGLNAAQAIMTTDLVPKQAFRQVGIGGRQVSIGGIAKGSGMIHPNMATMLAVLVTDAVIAPPVLADTLRRVVSQTFNRITVDGDTSTNDTVVILANGAAGGETLLPDTPALAEFEQALTGVCTDLARAIARDGEGATKLVEVQVLGAASPAEAEAAAKTVATSPLVKTALFGNDPNWGRVLAAVGRSGIQVDPARVSLRLGDFLLVQSGEPVAFDAPAVSRWLSQQTEVSVQVDLGLGNGSATVWTCDLSYRYVEINAEYHT
ncbi:MAG: bifunctional glutamate N-acetyltransferase/amino-acid acetyltransferase ArgJ [Chloroflexi bacterium]|nr:MAG: bifunctional glutamate N-acetyltransferase/amino-acid acetyltransferase ArgJ [Chloroflexota bacterium]